jgi:predicted  nucleic acid-binding Zn-ribbon protein
MASSSHVLDIRRRTAQERLRSDHIELFYQLEGLQKENDDLISYIKQLEKQLEDVQNLKTRDDEEKNMIPRARAEVDISNNEIASEEIKRLQKEIHRLENELKTFKTSVSLSEKTRQRHEV